MSQSGALQSSQIIMLLRHLSDAIKNQLKAPKSPYSTRGFGCLELVLYGI